MEKSPRLIEAERLNADAQARLDRARKCFTLPKNKTLDGILSLAEEMDHIRETVDQLGKRRRP